MMNLDILTAKIEPLLDKPYPSEAYKAAYKSPERLTIYNRREFKEESFTKETAIDWLETIGIEAACDMYHPKDLNKLMNFAGCL